MTHKISSLVVGFSLAAAAGLPHPAHAAAPYKGIYVVMDPYKTSDLSLLKTGAATACSAHPSSVAPSPFCGSVDGILLRTGWCKFELDHVTSGQNTSSCHYVLGYSNGFGSAVTQIPVSPSYEGTSSCPQNFDVCTNTSQSLMATALSYINKINTNRAAGALPPLKLSVGLEAGIWTPNTVLTSAGYVDVPHNTTSTGNLNAMQCYRLPKAWQASYVTAYDTAVDQFLSTIVAQMPAGANITILKASGITGDDLEVEMPGAAFPVPVPGHDPGKPSAGPGPLLNCSSTTAGAQTWLSAYNSAPIPGRTFAQAVEYSFGSIIGHEYASLNNLGIDALISIPNTGSEAFANADCGVSGASTCTVDPLGSNWSLYYLTQYVNDLFKGGQAASGAAAATAATRPGSTFAMQPAQLSLAWTAITPAPIVASSQVTCMMNNIIPAHDSAMTINGHAQEIGGIGTTIGWQTQTNQGDLCSAKNGNTYMTALNNGISQGGQYLEVEDDAVFTNQTTCGPDIAAASKQMLASLVTNCQY